MSEQKQQLTVNLPPGLIRAAKHRAIDEQQSLSDWVAGVLAARLGDEDTTSGEPRIVLQPMVHVPAMAAAVAFYEALGARIVNGSRDGDFVLLALGRSELSLLAHPANPGQGEGDVELNFESDDLDEVVRRLRSVGEIVSGPTDEGFGSQLQVRAPGGLLVKINELDAELYG